MRNHRNKVVGRIFFTLVIVIAVVAAACVSYITARSEYCVPILMYHSIDHKRDIIRLSISPNSFAKQMEFLHNNHYNVVGLDNVIGYLQGREAPPPKTVVITFDDGFYNNYKYAYPALKKYGFPATIFVITDMVGKPGWLSWSQIREMSDSGIVTIGSHTKSHKWLTSLDDNQLKNELAGSKNILEEKIGKRVDRLCYPNGIFDKRTEDAAKKAGYSLAVTTNPDVFYPRDDIYAIRRIKVSPKCDNLFVFWVEASKFYAWHKENRDK